MASEPPFAGPIAITGGQGHIGQAVVALALAQGHSVVCIDRRPPPDAQAERPGLIYRTAELTDFAAFVAALDGCAALIHLAAIPSLRVAPAHLVHNNNVVSSYNALGAAVELGIGRLVMASSINATGAVFSRQARYDYLPLDEDHPTYNEDAYSLSKWIGEQQADSFARRYPALSIASLRLHGVPPGPITPRADLNEADQALVARQLWGYTALPAAARACLLPLSADVRGHERFYVGAPRTMMVQPSAELKQRYYPDVPLRRPLAGNDGFYDCDKASRVLGWRHDE
jgi:UDP-glucose 4-epimerase